jgi:hypothetical protein
VSATQRARSGVPLDKRSLVVTVPGLPWWGVVLLAAGVTSIGVLIDASGGGGELTSVFSTFYFLGCFFAVVAAANKSLFTAMAQPPLLLLVAVPLAQTMIGKDNSTSLRDIAINIAYPLVDRFPVMLATSIVVLIIGCVRYFLLQQRPTGPVRSTRTRRDTPPATSSRGAIENSDPAQRRRRRPEPSRPDAAEATDLIPPQPRRRDTDRPTYSDRPVYNERPSYRPAAAPDRTPPRRSSAPVEHDRYQPPRRNQPVSERSDTSSYSERSDAPSYRERREYPSHSERRTPEAGRPSEERMEPFFASGGADDVPLPPRRRPAGADLPAYPAPRVRYRDRDETPS